MGFDHIIGHRNQKELLQTFLVHGNIPHAFLFSGPPGIGKKGLAKAFTQHLFCQSGSACGHCGPCIKLERDTHPDLLTVEADGSIGIDHSRMLSKEICEYPYESQKRVIVIDRAETLTREAANALLKTLEEPPPFNHFFLITSAEKEIPATIRSRCTRVYFGPLSRTLLRQFFVRKNIDENHAELLSEISYGSIGCGLFWVQEENLSLRRSLLELITGKQPGFVKASHIAEKIAKTNEGFEIFLAFLLSFLRDLSLYNHSGDIQQVTNKDVSDFLNWPKANPVWIETTLKRVQETASIMRYNINKWLFFENLLFQMMR